MEQYPAKRFLSAKIMSTIRFDDHAKAHIERLHACRDVLLAPQWLPNLTNPNNPTLLPRCMMPCSKNQGCSSLRQPLRCEKS
jgi:hypothetical protein